MRRLTWSRLQPKAAVNLATGSAWALALALVLLAIFATRQTRGLQQDIAQEERDRIKTEVQSALEFWQHNMTNQMTIWLFYMGYETKLTALQNRLRQESPTFDAFYLWDLSAHEMVFPPAAPAVDSRLEPSPCLHWAESMAPTIPSGVAATLYLQCLPAPPATELLITSRAARLYLDDNQPTLALAALKSGQVPLYLPLRESSMLAVESVELANRRFLAAEAYDRLGKTDQALRVLNRLGTEVALLDGPRLEDPLVEIAPSVVDALYSLGDESQVADLDALFERASRRQQAWQEVNDRVSLRAFPPPPQSPPQIVRDQYGSSPFVLLYRQINESGLVGAIQLDEPQLLQAFLDLLRPGVRNHLVIVDGIGHRVAGSGSMQDVFTHLAMPAPFGYLRVAISEGSLPSMARPYRFIVQTVVVVASLFLGGLALLARLAADRRQRELYARQREFVTRVTHELKTPLAGIRVMAEAIEIGAFRDDDDRANLAQHIGKETERPAARVDEVLRVARETQDFRPVPVAPLELAGAVADRFEYHMSQAGVAFRREFRPCPDLVAEPGLLRDALAALLDNAVKYRHPLRVPVIVFSVRPEGHRGVLFEVIDNGIGVPHTHRKSIFEPFTRVEGPDRGATGGHGLGLSFVANAARIHGGRAECKDGLDGGSAFVLHIPMRFHQGPWWRFGL